MCDKPGCSEKSMLFVDGKVDGLFTIEYLDKDINILNFGPDYPPECKIAGENFIHFQLCPKCGKVQGVSNYNIFEEIPWNIR